jgi:hypothetical protein
MRTNWQLLASAEMQRVTMADGIPCDGWWLEEGWGRQPMRDLRLKFEGGKISGSGYDIIGLFTFAGTISEQGHVAMTKRYVGQHTVDYVGQYDGEGLLWGEWQIGPLKDHWMIKFRSANASASRQGEIEEIN